MSECERCADMDVFSPSIPKYWQGTGWTELYRCPDCERFHYMYVDNQLHAQTTRWGVLTRDVLREHFADAVEKKAAKEGITSEELIERMVKHR